MNIIKPKIHQVQKLSIKQPGEYIQISPGRMTKGKLPCPFRAQQ